MADASNYRSQVPALERALNLLEYLAQNGAPTSVKQMSADLNIPLVSTYRMVGHLHTRGYLREEPPESGEYNLGPGLLQLAQSLIAQLQLVPAAAPFMRALAQATGHTAQLGILQDFGVMYIHQELPTRPVSIIAALRTVIPVNTSASGKVLVASLAREARLAFLERAELPCQTENSIADVAVFDQELDKVRAQGYATDYEEYARGIGCLAGPVVDYTGEVVAAIGITGRISDYTGKRLSSMRNSVLQYATQISASLGHVASQNWPTHGP